MFCVHKVSKDHIHVIEILISFIAQGRSKVVM